MEANEAGGAGKKDFAHGCIVICPGPGEQNSQQKGSASTHAPKGASGQVNGNGFGGYGETVFGTDGTLILEEEKEVLLYKQALTSGKTRVVAAKKKGHAALEVGEAADDQSAAIGQMAMLAADRGYAEELEHWAWCIRNPAPEHQPHCHPKVALKDAVIALTANKAAREGCRIDFEESWFDPDHDATPEGEKPDLSRYRA